MSIRYKKDKNAVFAATKLPISRFAGHHYMAYLWKNQTGMIVNAPKDMDANDDTGAYCCHAHYWAGFPDNGRAKINAPKRLGEIHFVQSNWNMEYVAHECFHATKHICTILQINPAANIQYEERAAYIHGEMVDRCYRWLWEVDRPKKALWKEFGRSIKNCWNMTRQLAHLRSIF